MVCTTRIEVVLAIRRHVRQAADAWSSGSCKSLSHDATRVASLWPGDQALRAATAMKTAQSAGLSPYIAFDRASGVPYYTQIYDGYRMAILSGRLGPGQRLPSTRTLAAELQISRLPVLNAFEQLLHEGYLEGKVGSGTYVRDCIPDEVARPMRLRRPVEPPQPVRRPSRAAAGVYGAYRDQGAGMFRSIPALDRFPHETFARLTRRHAAHLPPGMLAYGDPAGYAPLREAIAAYLRTARAVDCDAGQVIILSGSQMGLRVAAMTVTDAGFDRVHGGARVSGCAPCARHVSGKCRSGPDRQRGHRRCIDQPARPARAVDVRDAVASVPARSLDGSHTPARTPRLGRAQQRMDPRGRLRQRIPLLQPAARRAPGYGHERAGHLHRHIQQGAVPGHPARLRRRAA